MSQITTHILDTSRGAPAAGVAVALAAQVARESGDFSPDRAWRECGRGRTDGDGRCANLCGADKLAGGVYRLIFDTGGYFAARGVACFYPQVSVVFAIADDGQHYHVPLLLNPFGYSTYRGS